MCKTNNGFTESDDCQKLKAFDQMRKTDNAFIEITSEKRQKRTSQNGNYINPNHILGQIKKYQ